ncbi:MAG: hypothetical protein KDE47_05920 [Caldilineaceae bacterium]|nr:hypothetical protein [Caldilineaceae bacterium]
MWERLSAFWGSLTSTQRTIIIAAVVVLGLGILASFVFMGTDYSGFGDWLQGWFD